MDTFNIRIEAIAVVNPNLYGQKLTNAKSGKINRNSNKKPVGDISLINMFIKKENNKNEDIVNKTAFARLSLNLNNKNVEKM